MGERSFSFDDTQNGPVGEYEMPQAFTKLVSTIPTPGGTGYSSGSSVTRFVRLTTSPALAGAATPSMRIQPTPSKSKMVAALRALSRCCVIPCNSSPMIAITSVKCRLHASEKESCRCVSVTNFTDLRIGLVQSH